MAYYKAITQQGSLMFEQAEKTDQTVTVDSIIVSQAKTNPSDTTTVDVLSNPITLPIVGVDYQNGHYFPFATLINGSLTSTFTVNSLGIVGHLGNSPQQLLFIISDDSPTVVPPASSGDFTKNIVFEMIDPVTWSGKGTTAPTRGTNNNDQHIDLSNYVDQQELSNRLSGLLTVDNINGMLDDYVTKQYSDSLEAANAAKAVSYTDTQISNAVASLPKPSSASVDLSGYATVNNVNDAYQNAVNTAKSYTDSLNSSAMNAQNNYIGWVYGATISSANTYTDSKIAELKSYIDNKKG